MEAYAKDQPHDDAVAGVLGAMWLRPRRSAMGAGRAAGPVLEPAVPRHRSNVQVVRALRVQLRRVAELPVPDSGVRQERPSRAVPPRLLRNVPKRPLRRRLPKMQVSSGEVRGVEGVRDAAREHEVRGVLPNL